MISKKLLREILLDRYPNLKELKNSSNTNREWGYKYTFVYKTYDDSIELKIRIDVTRDKQNLEAFHEYRSEAIRYGADYGLEFRNSFYKGENRTTVFRANEWFTPRDVIKTYRKFNLQ